MEIKKKKPGKRRWTWIEHYNCGCTSQAARKKDLLGYCGTHGLDRVDIYKLPYTPGDEETDEV